jgi:transposase
MTEARELTTAYTTLLPEGIASSLTAEALSFVNEIIERLQTAEAETTRLKAEVEKLGLENQELRARLGKDSTNSSKPPSSDPPQCRYKRAKRMKSGKKAGGQTGHKGVTREVVPPERVDTIIEHRPETCSHCNAALAGAALAGEPIPRQVIELPEIRPKVVEHHFQALLCEACGTVNRAPTPPEAMWYTGPRLTAFAALLCGRYRLSREEAADLLRSALGVPISKATVQACCERTSAALAGPVDELVEALKQMATLFVDETGWKLAGARRWLWVAVATTFTVFSVSLRRGRQQLVDWLGAAFEGVVHSDRWSAYKMFSPEHRQLCWAHLLRDLQAIIDAEGEGKTQAESMTTASASLFKEWHAFKDGVFDRAELHLRTDSFRKDFRSFCEAGAAQKTDRRWRALGSDLIRLWPAVFRFLDVENVEPTNNNAEQAVRQAVIWRRSSQGSRSEDGAMFVGRVLTATTTCRRQGRSPLDFLTEAVLCFLHERPPPSLRPETS